MRNLNWSGRPILAASLGVALVVLAAWVATVVFLWLLLRAANLSTSLWAMLEALSTALAAALVIGAGLLAYRELKEVASSRYLEVADRLFSELNSQDNIEARRWIFQNLPDDPQIGIGSVSPEGRRAIKRVLNSLDRVAFLTQPGWIPEDMVMPWMSIMIVKAWAKLKPYVEYERARRVEPDYYRYAQNVAERCVAYRTRAQPNARVTWIDNAL